jgi:hypothetical protein
MVHVDMNLAVVYGRCVLVYFSAEFGSTAFADPYGHSNHFSPVGSRQGSYRPVQRVQSNASRSRRPGGMALSSIRRQGSTSRYSTSSDMYSREDHFGQYSTTDDAEQTVDGPSMLSYNPSTEWRGLGLSVPGRRNEDLIDPLPQHCEWHTVPSIADLNALSPESIQNVPSFQAIHPTIGKVGWSNVDLSNVKDLHALIKFARDDKGETTVTVYPSGTMKPAQGMQLNKEATIELKDKKPKKAHGGEPSHQDIEKFEAYVFCLVLVCVGPALVSCVFVLGFLVFLSQKTPKTHPKQRRHAHGFDGWHMEV